MPFKPLSGGARAIAVTIALGFCNGGSESFAAAKDYHFELVGKPDAAQGKDVVSVRLVRDGRPVPDAVIFESKADMGPAGMPTMTAPIKALPSKEPGVYRFEVEPGMQGLWAIRLAAKVQGETETVRGTVTAELAK